jgi:hypothetical protein
MDIYSTLGYIFSPTGELPKVEPKVETHKMCRYCETFHDKDGDFCSIECADNYEWEYQQEFYTSQNREQDTEQKHNAN